MSANNMLVGAVVIGVPLIHEGEPWHCTFCGKFMYNLDDEGYPTEGSPRPMFWSLRYSRLCQVCYSMIHAVADSEYFKTLQQKFEEKTDRLKKGN